MRSGSAAACLLCWIFSGLVSGAEVPEGPEQSAGPPQPLETVVVTGSHIPRANVEGPAPVVTISSADISSKGFATISDVMTSLTQNLGALDNNQNTDGFSPGAQAVDLRGLGPNHTLVLINGRRIADYPQSYGGNSNFTDISNIPTSLVDRIEILSGSASAIYGSDAISGVINFILKQKPDGTTVDLRAGDTQHGGLDSQRVQISSGYSNDRLDALFAVEYYRQAPLWAYQRDFTNSRLDSPGDPSSLYPSQVFNRIDADGNYIDPGQATCDALGGYDHHSVIYAHRQDYGSYCGSYRDVGYGTLENGRKAVNVYGTATYRLSEAISVFLDVQAGESHQTSYDTPLQWENSYPLNGDSTPVPFYNAATGQVEQWQRRYFTIEENGGFDPGTIHNINHTVSLNTGLKGKFGSSDWAYEALLGHSQSTLESKWPALVASAAQALYLGPSLGTDPDSGYQIYNAPVSRLYTPLTVQQFRSITRDSIDNNKSRSENITLTVNNPHLLQIPAGPVGFAAVAEWGSQHYELNVDPASLDGTYFGLHNTGAVGSRTHAGTGIEVNIPVLPRVMLTAASRFDSYHYSSTTTGKGTYSAGLEIRPVDSLLLRGSVGTGFRAPDLAYLYAGPSGSSSDGTDYYLCRRDEPTSGPDYFDNCKNGDVSFNGRSHGSTALKDETSTSFTYGFVFQPVSSLQVTADYYLIKLKNEVEYQSSDTILRQEAACRLGDLDINSSLCQQVISQVVRNPVTGDSTSEAITSVLVLPINAAVERTSGFDIGARYALDAGRLGRFDLSAAYTRVLTHTLQQFAGDPVDNELTDYFYYVIPKDKGNASIGWTFRNLTSTLYAYRVGGLPNYQGTARLAATALYNGSLAYRIGDRATVSFVIDNLFDQKPQRDPTWTSYPYYAREWFSPIGREFFLGFNYHLDWPH